MLKPILYALAGACAAVLITTTTALGGSGVGDVFNLGQANTVNAESSLTGSTSGGPQLRVENAATTQNAFGVLGRITAGVPGTLSAGLRGINSATNGNGFGVWGFHQSGGSASSARPPPAPASREGTRAPPAPLRASMARPPRPRPARRACRAS